MQSMGRPSLNLIDGRMAYGSRDAFTMIYVTVLLSLVVANITKWRPEILRWFQQTGGDCLLAQQKIRQRCRACSGAPREKLKVPPRPFPLEELSHYNHSGQLQVFSTQLEPNVHGVRQSSHVSVETNSNKRISILGTNHTKIYRVNLMGFKHRVEDPARSPHKQSKYTLRSKRFSNVLTNHQGRFPKPWDR